MLCDNFILILRADFTVGHWCRWNSYTTNCWFSDSAFWSSRSDLPANMINLIFNQKMPAVKREKWQFFVPNNCFRGGQFKNTVLAHSPNRSILVFSRGQDFWCLEGNMPPKSTHVNRYFPNSCICIRKQLDFALSVFMFSSFSLISSVFLIVCCALSCIVERVFRACGCAALCRSLVVNGDWR